MIRCAEGLSTVPDSNQAIAEVVAKLEKGLAGERADLTLIFASADHADSLGQIAKTLQERGLGRVILGCTCESVVGEGREIEGSPALVCWSAHLPGVDLAPFALEGEKGWPEEAGSGAVSAVILLGDPFSFPSDEWLRRVEVERPGLMVAGGMASGGRAPGENRLVLGTDVKRVGAVGVAIGGGISIRSVVSQGCRPIGRPLIVTRAERNIIRELGRRPALEVLQEIFQELSEEDRERAQAGLHVGRVINEYQEAFRRGDFLVRNVLGVDQEGGIAVGELMRVGQTVQFHIRDASTADEDLRRLIDEAQRDGPAPSGALLFTCNGRGSRLFAVPNHDVGILQSNLGPIPTAGFFAMGEIGPVGGRNFVHGFTASVVLFAEGSETAAS